MRQSIGARYVPKFAEPSEWTPTRTYEPLTIVTYYENSYTSKKNVPQGVDIGNREYWALTGSLNGAIRECLTEINNIKLDISKLKDLKIVNVKDFGAKGDGVTDDTDAIQNAINSKEYISVFLPQGNYKVTRTITVHHNTRIVGEGVKITTITASFTNGDVFASDNIGDGRTFEDFTIEQDNNIPRVSGYMLNLGNREHTFINNVQLGNNSSTTDSGNGIYSNGTLVFITNLNVETRGNFIGILFDGGNDKFLTNCWLRGNGNGVGLFVQSSGGDFYNNIDIVQFGNDMVLAPNTEDRHVDNLFFVNCLFDSAYGRNVRMIGGSNLNVENINFSNCWFGSAGLLKDAPSIDDCGCYMINVNKIIFDACEFISNRGGAITVESADDLKINECTTYDNCIALPNTANDIQISNGKYVNICNNSFDFKGNHRAKTNHCISIASGDYIIVKNNIGRSNSGTAEIADDIVNKIVNDNFDVPQP